MKLPSFLKKYFWNVDFTKLDLEKDSFFVINRILEYGDIKGLCWLFKKVKRKQIEEVIMKSRELSPKTANFWALFLNLNKNKILCLKKSYQKMQRTHWAY
ncbi:MAG: hypothetical protein HQ538_03990 [Parcubacteria group bacterium]|nr:hypothetical protein [Parcubacteria group bacterium]